MAQLRQYREQLFLHGRAILAAFLGLLMIFSCVFLIGFLIFANSLARTEPLLDLKAEGVVALTGGADRVVDAANFLARGQAKRLLITGVNRATRSSVLARILPISNELFKCCVDLGYQAVDTAGNAAETKVWAETYHIGQSLIVVTSNYHMPRALLELSAALPNMTLYPFPVVSDHTDVSQWWHDKRIARLVGGEYVKFLGALIRIHLDPERSDNDPN